MKNMQDERVVAQSRKIKSEAFVIIMIVLLASILVQCFYLNAPFEQYAVEVICFIGMCIYVIVRYMKLGLNIFDDEKPTKHFPLISGIVVGLLVTVINGVCHYTQDSEFDISILTITFTGAAVITFVALSCLGYLNRRRQEQILQNLDKEEQDECR